MSTHLAVGLTAPFTELTTFQRPTTKPAPNQLLVKTLALGFTPLTQWQVDFGLLVAPDGLILGGNLVGEVTEVGSDLANEYKISDKIFAFQYADPDGRPFQEYVLVTDGSFGLIPPNLTIEQAATIPDSFVTAFHSFLSELSLPIPLSFPPSSPPEKPDTPILIWGGGSSCGQYAIQLLAASGYKNVHATASPARFPYLSTLGNVRLHDYSRPLPSDLPPFEFVLDCIGDEAHSVEPISKLALTKNAKVAVLLPVRKGGYGSTSAVTMDIETKFPEGVEVIGVRTHFYKRNPHLATALQKSIMPSLFGREIIKPTAHRVVEGNSFLERTRHALQEVRDGKVRGEKLIVFP